MHAQAAISLTEIPLRIALIVLGAGIVIVVLRFIVSRLTKRLTESRYKELHVDDNARITLGTPGKRSTRRLRTFQSVTNSTIGAIVGTVAFLMILSEIGVDVGPLIASAGVVGVALAFGAQSLVRDVISGIFMLIEDQYGVGDRVELGTGNAVMATGVIEQTALRVTVLRDDDGRLWHVRNGEILRVANASQGWVQAIAEVRVAPETDLALARDTLNEITAALRADADYDGAILSDGEVRIEDVSAEGVGLRWSVRTKAGEQWRVASAFRRRLVDALAAKGIALAD